MLMGPLGTWTLPEHWHTVTISGTPGSVVTLCPLDSALFTEWLDSGAQNGSQGHD